MTSFRDIPFPTHGGEYQASDGKLTRAGAATRAKPVSEPTPSIPPAAARGQKRGSKNG